VYLKIFDIAVVVVLLLLLLLLPSSYQIYMFTTYRDLLNTEYQGF
jgi:hypothetical protein